MIAAAAEASSFDHNATTPLCAAARAAVVDAWAHHGNPSAGHRGAGPARRRLALARAQLAGLLNAQPMGFYAPATIVDDAKRHGVQVLPVDVTRSSWQCTLSPCRTAEPVGARWRATRWA